MRAPYILLPALVLLIAGLLASCSQKGQEEPFSRDTGEVPYGTWQVVDIQKALPGGLTVILTLDRFKFSWTTLLPARSAIFYEAGDIVYSVPERRMTFRVKASKVMDQRSGIPREVFDEERTSYRSHVPGQQYAMTWIVGKNEVLVLTGPETETTYLRRIKPTGPDSASTTIDASKGG